MNTAANVTLHASTTVNRIVTQYATPQATSSQAALLAALSAGPRVVTLGGLATNLSDGNLHEAPYSLLSTAVTYTRPASVQLATITIDNRHSSQLLSAHAPSHTASTAAPSEGKTTSAAFAHKDTGGMTWPIVFNLILLVLMLVSHVRRHYVHADASYAALHALQVRDTHPTVSAVFLRLTVCLTYAHRLSPRNIGSGLFLRKQPSSGASDHTQHPCRGYVSPAKAKSRLQARLRGLYNRYFLYTVPLGGLTIAQLVVLALYCGSAVVADYVLQGAVAGNAIRSGRTACIDSALTLASC